MDKVLQDQDDSISEKFNRLENIMTLKNTRSLYHYEYLAAANEFINRNGKWTGPDADIEVSKKMLSYEIDPRMVGQMIKDLSPEVAGLNVKGQGKYIKDIITQAQKEYESTKVRIKEIVGLDASLAYGITKDYQLQAKEIISQKGWLRNDTDVQISQKLLLAGRTKLEVHEALKKLSPEVAGKSSIEASQYAKTILAKAVTPEIQKSISKAKGIER